MRDCVRNRFRMAFAALAVAFFVAPAGRAGTPEDSVSSKAPVEWAQATEDTAPPATPLIEAPAEPDTAAAPIVEAEADTTVRVPLRRVRQRERREGGSPNVAWTTIRSGILPGWGQLANGKPLKALLLGGIYAGWAYGAYSAETDRLDLKDMIDAAGVEDPALVDELNEAVNRRNFRLWMMGATMLYAMIDAYVDAHFLDYEETWSAGFRPDAPALAVTVRF
jgi:hypothetical protein